jgi:hypothetical protein
MLLAAMIVAIDIRAITSPRILDVELFRTLPRMDRPLTEARRRPLSATPFVARGRL